MKIFKGLIIFTFFILVISNIIYYTKTISLSNELFKLENEINKLEVENKKIERNIAKIDNIDFLSSKAAELGLKHNLRFWYLQQDRYAFKNTR
mgnify:FL=1